MKCRVITLLPTLFFAVAQTVDVVMYSKTSRNASDSVRIVLKENQGDFGNAHVIVGPAIKVDAELVTIKWTDPDCSEETEEKLERGEQTPLPSPAKRFNLSIVVPLKKPKYNANETHFRLALEPNVDGEITLLLLKDYNLVLNEDNGITLTFDPRNQASLTEQTLQMLKPRHIPYYSNENEFQQKFIIGNSVNSGKFGGVANVTLASTNDAGYTNKLVMKSCLGFVPGSIWSISDWAKMIFDVTVNKNDFRIGHLLNPFVNRQQSHIPIYYEEGLYSDKHGDYYFFIMERLGDSIATELDTAMKNNDYVTLCTLYLAMIQPLIWIHENGVVHRDLKGNNFLRSKNPGSLELKIIDFGISRIAVEWEEHIKQNDSIQEIGVANSMSVRAGLCLGTDFNDDLEQLVNEWACGFTNSNFFGDTGQQLLKSNVLKNNWTTWPQVIAQFSKRKPDEQRIIATNLNDLFTLCPILKFCRNTKFDLDNLKVALQAIKLFPTYSKISTNNFLGNFGYLKDIKLPEVIEIYEWPLYGEYKKILANMKNKGHGGTHPLGNFSLRPSSSIYVQ